MRTTGSSGSMALLTEYDDATARELRSLRLESTEDGKGILLIEVDERKPGIHREVRYEITPAELIAAIRAHGAELPGEQHNHRTVSRPRHARKRMPQQPEPPHRDVATPVHLFAGGCGVAERAFARFILACVA